ncbi:MAG: DNA repair protein RadC [Victivallaceae bacterium]|nr:DNA repair protein RadC [Victivallaceae bacterium]
MDKASLNSGHRGRLRGRLLAHGLESLQDYEAIELLLTFAIPRRDVKPIAKAMMAKFGSIERILDASPDELISVEGSGPACAALVKLLKELCGKYLEAKLSGRDILLDSPRRVVDFCRMKLTGGKKETLMLIYLNARNYFIDFQCFSGTVDRAAVFVREVAESAIRLHATGVIAAHNHPSNVCDPSQEDMTLTTALQRALDAVGIKLHDHLVVTREAAYSIFHRRYL